MDTNIAAILSNFKLTAAPVSADPIKTGHINKTYRVTCADSAKYTLQAINTYVFKNPAFVMDNIVKVTTHLRAKIINTGGDPLRETLTVIQTNSGEDFFFDGGEYWRCYIYIDGARSYDLAKSNEQLRLAGEGFGIFARMLSDFPINQLHDTIPDFHNTAKRMDSFFEAVSRDAKNRAASVKDEIGFFEKNRDFVSRLSKMQESGIIPLRVTHNDTKFNNVLIDDGTGKPLCIIDLDTVMPGLSVHDFGDAVRFAASTAAEDERDLSKVEMDIHKYESFTSGFIGASTGFLDKTELEYMPLGALTITAELASRFLLDHLEGDLYFRIERENHNLDRARNQIKLAQSMLAQFDKMNEIAGKYI